MTKDSSDKHAIQAELAELKIRKSRAKSALTKGINRFKGVVEEEELSSEQYDELISKIDYLYEDAVRSITDIVTFHKDQNSTEDMVKASDEVAVVEKQYEECLNIKKKSKGDVKTLGKKHESVSSDMYTQLKRVTIPVFTGVKRQYEFWKSAFMACVDETHSSPEYKFLQLRQYLGGDALKLIDGLGHSASAYEAAKERLERKYGGVRRQMAIYLDELDNFPILKDDNAKMTEKFAELIDIISINLREAGRTSDLGDGVLYIKMQKKMTENMLTSYHRWLKENGKLECVDTLRCWLIQESEYRTVAQEIAHGLEGQKQKSRVSHVTYFTNKHNNRVKKCKVCAENHGVWACALFKAMNENERWEKAKSEHLCFRCLGTDHIGNHCLRGRICQIDGCKKMHHRLLHTTTSNETPKIEKTRCHLQSQPQSTEHVHTTISLQRRIALRTVPVILTANNKRVKINALLDDASTKTYLNVSVARELGLRSKTEKVSVNVLNGKCETFETMPVTVKIESETGNVKMNIEAHTTERVTGNLRTVNWNEYSDEYPHLRGIQFPHLKSTENVDMLIGIDYLDLHTAIFEARGQPGEPVARLTPLGWTCVGNIKAPEEPTSTFHTYFVNDTELNRSLRQFWEIEEVCTEENNMSQIDRKVMNEIGKTVRYEDNRYEIGVPWKDSKQLLKNNLSMAMKRLENTEKKLKKNPEVGKMYKETIERYVENGYIEKIEDQTKGDWFLPHFPVIRLDKSTTKVRVVFDASAKSDGMSLNDTIHHGPKLQADLSKVLLRFRKNPVAVICDIQEMYLQIKIPEQERQYFCFLWRDDTNKEPVKYQFNRLVFGVNASPFLAQYITQENAKCHETEFPLATETVLKSTYMDDSMDSVKDSKQGIELYHQLSQLWKMAGMHARKWLSNSKSVCEEIPKEDRVTELDLSQNDLPVIKTLGLTWDAKEDEFIFKAVTTEDHINFTKRSVLSKISSLFDPHGFLSPYIVRTKMLMQDVWLSGIDWDDELPEDLQNKAKQWFSELKDLKDIKVARCLKPDDVVTSTLQVFVDASTKAYGAVIYLRNILKDGSVSVRFVASKSHVAPLKTMSVPRLELEAAVLGLKLAQNVCEGLEMDIHYVQFWSDSLNVLWWIRGQSRQYKTFVANRIGEIHSLTEPEQWQYISTKENPADYVSRGSSIAELSESSLWWNGPKYLLHDSSTWNLQKFERTDTAAKELKKQNKIDESVFITKGKELDAVVEEDKLDPECFSDWIHYVRIYAWVKRFIDNCQVPKEERQKKELTASEIQNAKNQIIKHAQRECFQDEIKCLEKKKGISTSSKLRPLNPKLDDEGVMRSDSRLTYAKHMSYNFRFPVILPRRHHVTKLIVKHHHEMRGHSGTSQTLASLSSKYWVVCGREEIRDLEKECRECRRRKAMPSEQIMAPVPKMRLGQSMRAFSNTAVDYAGPFLTKQGRGKTRQKRYICVFTCMATRAIHIELAYSLDTNSFMNCFCRFCSRRGIPDVVVSDNGTNFVGAYSEFKELYEHLDKNRIEREGANKGIQWYFNPPGAPHFGGVFESMVKSAKRSLFAILGDADVTDEDFLTAVVGAEGLINSRPITYQTANPNEDCVITPNHFLHGQVGGCFAPESTDTTAFSITRRWRRIQELLKHFWQRWMREYLPSLATRKKWHRENRNFQPGDVVLIVEPDTTRGKWPLGKVVAVHPGSDGHVRVVSVLTKNKVFKRPISKLCIIEPNM